jgi:hypothetical protein
VASSGYRRRVRRALALAMVLVLAPLLADAISDAAVASGPADHRYVPMPFPDGWFVSSAVATVGTSDASGSAFYAQRDDLEHGRALSVTTVGVESGFDGLRDDHPARVSGLQSSTLARNGRFAWLTWPDDTSQDVEHLVAGRDLDDADVIAAARAIEAGTFPRKGVPDGLAPVRDGGGASPDYVASRQRISLVDATGMRHVDIDVSPDSVAVRATQRFWVEQVALREHAHRAQLHAVFGPQRRVTVVARGDGSTRELHRIAGSMQMTDAAGWQAFRGRVADLPTTALFPGAPPDGAVVIDGAGSGTRWAVAFETGALSVAWSTIATADGMTSGAGPGIPPGELPAVLSGGGFGANGGTLFAGVVPAAATSARFVPDGRTAVDAVLGPPTADGTHRYLAAWVPGVARTVPLVVYDASGSVLVQRRSFGCNVCED